MTLVNRQRFNIDKSSILLAHLQGVVKVSDLEEIAAALNKITERHSLRDHKCETNELWETGIVHSGFNERIVMRILFKVQKPDRNPCSRSAHATVNPHSDSSRQRSVLRAAIREEEESHSPTVFPRHLFVSVPR